MLRQKVSEKYTNGWNETPKSRYNLQQDDDDETGCETPVLSEKRLAVCGLIVSLFVMVIKLLSLYGKYFCNVFHKSIALLHNKCVKFKEVYNCQCMQ